MSASIGEMEEAGHRKRLEAELSNRLHCWAFAVGDDKEVRYGSGF